MIEDASTQTTSSPATAAPSGSPRDTIHYLCRILGPLAWAAILLWVLAPKGSRWASAAGDAGLAWILLTSGGYYAEQTVRSFVDSWKAYFTSWNQVTTCKNEENSPR
jgi:hypothetical protein